MNHLIIALLAVVKIAAFNSSDVAKRAADVVCTGNHDEKTIQTILDRFDRLCNNISEGLPAEIEARQKQYEYYRDKLLTFKEKAI